MSWRILAYSVIKTVRLLGKIGCAPAAETRLRLKVNSICSCLFSC